jgi:uracil-DNA glycosylase family 4
MRPATYVPPSGSKNATYIVVGEQPGMSEIRNGRPFCGSSGQELYEDLRMAGINSSDCYFTNVIKDADEIIDNYISFHPRRGPHVTEKGQHYIDALGEEISNHPGRVIIALGNIALFALTDRVGITKWRGSVLRSTITTDRYVVPSVHPSTIIPPKNQYTNKRLLIYDLKRAKEVAEGSWTPLNRDITIRPTFQQCIQFLTTCEMWGYLGNPIAYDIEVDIFNGEMTCISFAYSPCDVISIPFIGENGDYFTPPQEAEILLHIARLLEDPKIPILGQNMVFDCHYLLRKYGIKTSNIHDTMVAQKTLLPDYPVGLHFICSLYTDLPYYKDDGKYWLKGIGTFDSGWKYNALDSIVCADAYPKQVESLIKQHNYPAYERKRQSILPYVYLMEHGIKINIGSMKQAYDELGVQIEDAKARLNQLAGKDFNANSPIQVKNYFYVEKKLPVYKNKEGKASSDEKALKRISRKGYEEAALILKIRGLTKERATFLDINKVDTDGRMRCSYNPVGTRFSRASSSENIFGTGNNLQNQPHTVLTHFLADPYNVFYGMDLSQAENRLVAYIGRITQMIEAFESKKDIHSLVALMMANLFFNNKLPSDFDPRKTIAPIGKGDKPWRDWGKKSGHAANYDISYKTLALANEIPEREAKVILNIYHTGFPGVRNGFHAYVQQCLRRDRTLTNYMGRKTVFTDRIDDELFRAAYACIPQGTVGDIIDQRGLNFIYYHHNPLFKNVELLIQVHDQIGFQIPTPYHPTNPVPWTDHVKILLMVKESLERPLYTHYGRKFVIPVDTTMGVCLNKDKGKDLKVYTAEELADSYHTITARWLPEVINAM